MGLLKDVRSEIGKLDRTAGSLRRFGLTMTVAFALIGALVFIFGDSNRTAYVLWGVGAAFLAAAMLKPVSLSIIHMLWMGLSFTIGWFVSRIILVVLFYTVITPISLALKLTGFKNGDLINQKIDKEASTYWIPREPEEFVPKRSEKLY